MTPRQKKGWYADMIDRKWDEAHEAGTVSDEEYDARLAGLAEDAQKAAEQKVRKKGRG